MMTQEEYMDVLAMRRQGLSYVEISEATGYHPATVAKWVRNGGPPPARVMAIEDRVVDPVWEDRLNALLVGNPRLLATSLFDIAKAEGFSGSYPSVARWVNEQRGPRFRRADSASVPIETAPGVEAQFDFADCSAWAERAGFNVPVLWCFSMILCWSRWRLWWFTTSVDREHTFEGMVRFFDAVGGVPQVCRTDRMGCLGSSQGRRFNLHPPTLEFARWHGTEIKACQAGDAKRKGKVERPFRDLGESFLEELVVTGVPESLDGLNGAARLWLEGRHDRVHRTTGVPPIERFAAEHGFLGSLPRRRFDTDYTDARRVHPVLPLIEWNTIRYSVPPQCLGQTVEVRQAVDDNIVTVVWAGRQVARHHVPTDPNETEVWDPAHRVAAETAALNSTRRRHLHIIKPDEVQVLPVGRLHLPGGDFDVAAPDLGRYDDGTIA